MPNESLKIHHHASGSQDVLRGHERPFLIWGAYGGTNMGDEAILFSLVQLLRKQGHEGEIHVVCYHTPKVHTVAEYKAWGVQPIPLRRRPIEVMTRLCKERLIVGGGQLIDDSGLLWPTGLASAFIVLNHLFHNEPVLIGIGAESLRKPLQRLLVGRLYGLASRAACRDETSRQTLLDVGFPEANCVSASDLVFSADLPTNVSARDTREAHVAIVVSQDPRRLGSNADLAIQLIHHLRHRQRVARITVLPHDVRSPSVHGVGKTLDIEALNVVRRKVSSEEVQFVIPCTLAETLECYNRATVVVSARMHPLIIGAVMGVAPVAIQLTRKVASICERIPMPVLLDESAAAPKWEAVDAAVEAPDVVVARIESAVQAERLRAHDNAKVFLSGRC